MGIIKAGISAMQGAAADQWKEIFCAGEMGSDLLLMRARRMSGPNSVNQGSHDVITHGSLIIVGEGECAIATEGGKIIGVYDQPGEQTFQSNQSRGVFGGGLGSFIKDVGNRISFGGDVGITQRLYYINTKELTGGTIRADGVPLRFKDPVTGLDMDGGVSCHGSYTFRISDPERFFNEAIRSPDSRYRRDLLKQMDSEMLTALSPALSEMTAEGVRPNELLHHTETLCEKLRILMSDKWSVLRGIEVFSIALDSVQVLDADVIRSLQRDAALKDPLMAAGHLVGASADAMQTAAANPSGMSPLAAAILRKPSTQYGRWTCSCGADNSGKFCENCGRKRN